MNLNPRAATLILVTSLFFGIAACVPFLGHFLVDRFTSPVVVATYPTQGEVGVPCNSHQTLIFSKRMNLQSISTKTITLFDDHNQVVTVDVAHANSNFTATVWPFKPLHPGTTYRLTVLGGQDGIRDERGHTLARNLEWNFTTGVLAASSPTRGPGGPLLLITSPENGFSQYYAEILRNEGFNEFETVDVSELSKSLLQKHEIAVLGEVAVNEQQIATISKWVHGGGDLITMRPDPKLARALGIQINTNNRDPGGDQTNPPLHDGYLAIQPTTAAGAGLVHETIQFHGPTSLYPIRNGTVVATLYNNATTATPFPAIGMIHFGQGEVVFFSYDLARSVIYTRQGNPKWSGMERDGIPPIRSDDLFYGASASDPEPDWVDPQKIGIPQADVQQRLLANLITLSHGSEMPLPHFWYLPRGLKAAVVLTGDDHGEGGTVERFKSYMDKSPKGCSVDNWECVRATSNVFVGSISPEEAARAAGEGFEIGLHVYTKCADWPSHILRQSDGTLSSQMDRESADGLYNRQFAEFAVTYPALPSPVSNRIDCATWGDYDTQPQVELSHGIRLDTNYYFWPAKWVQNRPGYFTGSAMPMRFAKRDGTMLDIYQAATQMTDESAQEYPFTIETLLSKALGSSEFYGVLTANMHNDQVKSAGADAIISAALQRHVPLVTAAQMLKWLDGRNASSFQDLTWSKGQLGFNIEVGENANGIQALLPISSGGGTLVSLTEDGSPLEYQTRSIDGLNYAAFPGRPGKMLATYQQIGK